jgi:predicted transcriptional regulator
MYYNVININTYEVTMNTITTRISDDLDNALSVVAKTMERSKSFIISKAIKKYVMELQEDIADAEDALAAMKDNSQNIPWEQIQRNCGLLED